MKLNHHTAVLRVGLLLKTFKLFIKGLGIDILKRWHMLMSSIFSAKSCLSVPCLLTSQFVFTRRSHKCSEWIQTKKPKQSKTKQLEHICRKKCKCKLDSTIKIRTVTWDFYKHTLFNVTICHLKSSYKHMHTSSYSHYTYLSWHSKYNLKDSHYVQTNL